MLAERRESAKPVVSGRTPIECVNGEVRWWTFAGGRINATLRYALEALGEGWQVIPDNFVVKVRGESLDQASFHRALGRLREIEFWEDEALWGRVAQALPNYRLSKFQPLMPPWIAREVVASTAGYCRGVAVVVGRRRCGTGAGAGEHRRSPTGGR